MNQMPKRIAVFTKDIMNITGRQERTARKIISLIRQRFNKPKGSFISVEEFCNFTGLKQELVCTFLT